MDAIGSDIKAPGVSELAYEKTPEVGYYEKVKEDEFVSEEEENHKADWKVNAGGAKAE